MSSEELEELLELYEEKDKLKYIQIQTPDYCKNCANNPANGGLGFCNCILGLDGATSLSSSSLGTSGGYDMY